MLKQPSDRVICHIVCPHQPQNFVHQSSKDFVVVHTAFKHVSLHLKRYHQSVMLAHQERVRIFGYPVPQYFWFMLSGALCDMVQACLYYIVSVLYVSTWEKPTVCWTVSYILSIWARHTSHRILVFGEFEGTYLSSVIRMYLTYGSSIVFSTILSHVLSSWFMLSHSQALVCTVLPTGLYNYFMIRNTWKSAPVEKTTDMSSNV